MLAGLEFAQRVAVTAPIGPNVVGPNSPASGNTTGPNFEMYVKTVLQTLNHPVGTCAMAPEDWGGVVSPELMVYGTSNLRVIDASIFPLHIAAHPAATVYAVAEKAAAMLNDN